MVSDFLGITEDDVDDAVDILGGKTDGPCGSICTDVTVSINTGSLYLRSLLLRELKHVRKEQGCSLSEEKRNRLETEEKHLTRFLSDLDPLPLPIPTLESEDVRSGGQE